MKQGDTVTLRGRIVSTSDRGHEHNVCLEPVDGEDKTQIGLTESRIKALSPAKNKAVIPQREK